MMIAIQQNMSIIFIRQTESYQISFCLGLSLTTIKDQYQSFKAAFNFMNFSLENGWMDTPILK